MKQIKNFQTITKEGFSVANLQRFPSKEWGDEGGFQADVLFKSQKIAQVFQQGDGGCADVYFEKDLTKEFLAEVKDNLISFLKRYDYCYQESSPYEWLKKKTAQDVGNDEFETLVVNIEAAEDNFKLAQDLKQVLIVLQILYILMQMVLLLIIYSNYFKFLTVIRKDVNI